MTLHDVLNKVNHIPLL